MRKIYLLACLILMAGSQVFSQAAGCDGTRYQTEDYFAEFDLTSDLLYGNNITQSGVSQDLLLDVYEPQGDTAAARPCIVLVHGGTFITGNKGVSDVKPPAERYAKMGYVAVPINYRLGLPFAIIDSVDIIEATLRGVHDAKAAVRYLYKDRATDNNFRIDTNRIYVMGVSAGGIIALHYAYLDELAELPPDLDTNVAGLGGGMPGLTGNLGYSDKIAGVINVSGALGDTAWMHPGDEPVVSIHSPSDDIVPFGTALASVFTFPLMVVDGSESVHIKAEEIGLDNCFYVEYGGGHAIHASSTIYTDTLMEVSSEFIHGLACEVTPVCADFAAVGIDKYLLGTELQVYPNPALDRVTVKLEEEAGDYTAQLVDMAGKVIWAQEGIHTSTIEIQRKGWAKGVYFLKVNTNQKQGVRRIMWE